MAKGKDRIENDENKSDLSTFVAVKATEVRDRFSPQGAVLPPDIAAAPDATDYANTLIKVFETGKGGIFQHGAGETEFKRVPEHHPKIKEKKYQQLDVSKFVLVKTTTPTRVKGVSLPPDVAAAPDATEVANTITSVFETGQSGIFSHGAGETRFKKK